MYSCVAHSLSVNLHTLTHNTILMGKLRVVIPTRDDWRCIPCISAAESSIARSVLQSVKNDTKMVGRDQYEESTPGLATKVRRITSRANSDMVMQKLWLWNHSSPR